MRRRRIRRASLAASLRRNRAAAPLRGDQMMMGSEPIVELLLHHYEPLLQRWQHAGRLHDDLDYRAIVEWLNATTLFLLTPSWRHRPTADKRQFVEQFLVRALVPQIRQ